MDEAVHESKTIAANRRESQFSQGSAAERSATKPKDVIFLDWLKGYLDTIALIAGLGSSITFSVIVSEIVDPTTLDTNLSRIGAVFKLEEVRLIISLGWALFTISVGISIFAKILFIDPVSQRNLKDNMKSRAFRSQLSVVLFLLNLLPALAFTLVSLAVTAYVPSAGWLTTVCSGSAALLAFIMSIGLLSFGPSIPRLMRELKVRGQPLF